MQKSKYLENIKKKKNITGKAIPLKKQSPTLIIIMRY